MPNPYYFDIAAAVEQMNSCTKSEVERVLSQAGSLSLLDFAILLSPVAGDYLEEMAKISFALTRKRFGQVINLYIPLYLSNECANICTYCGYSSQNKIPRKILSEQEIKQELKTINSMGFDSVLLLTGESPKRVGIDYLLHALKIAKQKISHIGMEVQPLSEKEYVELIQNGLDYLAVYQETYHLNNYQTYHLSGKKKDYHYRLKTVSRAAEQGIRKISMGVLLGLSPWREDSLALASHYLMVKKQFWQTKFSISFPRINEAEGVDKNSYFINDKQYLQLIFAWRMLSEDLELNLSTRENAQFRDKIFSLGFTHLSAGSSTQPGGYHNKAPELDQFAIHDKRDVSVVANIIRSKGYEVVWKDWDVAFR